jgi:hypothetical protein
MVIGRNKEGAIQKEPLLRRYFDLFQRIIKEGDKCLLVIGYGFGDSHVNDVLCDAVKNHGLKLVLVTTTSPYQFRENLRNGHFYNMAIRDGIIAHFNNTLREIFPPDQNGSVYLEDLMKTLQQASSASCAQRDSWRSASGRCRVRKPSRRDRPARIHEPRGEVLSATIFFHRDPCRSGSAMAAHAMYGPS